MSGECIASFILLICGIPKLRRVLLTSPLPDGRSPQEIVKQSVIEVSTRELFDLEGGGRKPKRNGALDGRMVVNPEDCGVLIVSTLMVESV